MNFSACCSVSSSVAPSSGGVKPVRVEYFSHLCESFCVIAEKKETKKKRRKEPTRERERERERESGEVFLSLSLYCLLFLKNPKKTTTRRINDEHGDDAFISPFLSTLRVRAGAFSFTQKQRADWISFFHYIQKETEKMHFFPNRARERAGEREREKRLKERERRERVLRTEKKRRPRWVR